MVLVLTGVKCAGLLSFCAFVSEGCDCLKMCCEYRKEYEVDRCRVESEVVCDCSLTEYGGEVIRMRDKWLSVVA